MNEKLESRESKPTKDIIKKVQRLVEWENHSSIQNIKELLQLNSKQKTNSPSLKMGIGPELIFLQGRNLNGHEAHEKIFNIISHWGDANPSHKEVPPLHTH